MKIPSPDTSTATRLELVIAIASAARTLVRERGIDGKVGGMAVRTLTEDVAEITAMTYGVQEPLPSGDGKHGLDIWFSGRKVFSIRWNSMELRDYILVNFKRGPCIPRLLQLAAEYKS